MITKCDEACKIVLIICKHLATLPIMDWNTFEIAQDMSKDCSWHSKSKNDMILPKRFTRGLRVRYEARIIWIPYTFIEVLWDHIVITLVEMLPYITLLYWGVKSLGFLGQQELKSYLDALKLALDCNLFLLPDYFFSLKSFSWIHFSIFLKSKILPAVWKMLQTDLTNNHFRLRWTQTLLSWPRAWPRSLTVQKRL